MFEFIPELHQYYLDGRRIPATTQVLDDYGLVDYDGVPEHILRAKAELGTEVHEHCLAMDLERLDWGMVTDEQMPYVLAWESFRATGRFEAFILERRGHAWVDGLPYGFTADREGLLDRRPAVLEIKTTSNVERSWGPQLAAYASGLYAADKTVRHRVAVHLKPNGTYALHAYSDVRDYVVFKLALRQWWERNGGNSNGSNGTDRSGQACAADRGPGHAANGQ